ncbi:MULTISPECIES: DUF4233 domain-containing protein [Streptomyces]|uniref:DUF4233 domain-containing protein n=1 Tax=Streptomyces TaxID=1883 RepID=UPI000CD59F15|nr:MULTISPECIES: DUF4233 domain-containing protein [Streptomyces]
MRTLCSATLLGEFLIVGLAGLVASRLTDVSPVTLWVVCGAVMALCVLLCGVVGRPGGVALGWALQVGLILSGFLVPIMFFLGACFAGLWWASVHFGRRIDELKAAHAAAS